jgi:hypothetical protein
LINDILEAVLCYKSIENASKNAETAHTHTPDSGIDCNSFVCCMCSSGVCDRALENAQELKKMLPFSAASAFLPQKVSDKNDDALQVKH